MGKLYVSQNLDFLAECLVAELDAAEGDILVPRWVVAPPRLKQWLSLKIAKGSLGQIFAGCKIVSPEEAVFPASFSPPTPLEMRCLIYRELEQSPPKEALPFLSGGKGRTLDLANHIASLFASYGLYGKDLFTLEGNWQTDLLRKLFVGTPLRTPVQVLPEGGRTMVRALHCFGIDYLPDIYWQTLLKNGLVNVYLFSPCVHYWEDVCTHWEKRRLLQKKGSSQLKESLTRLLDEAPPLLANWGKLGRLSLRHLDALAREEVYALPKESPSLLHQIQGEVLSFAKEAVASDFSVRILETGSSKLNEVLTLRDQIQRIAAEENIPFSEIAVYAPDIAPYVPLIELSFAQIPYRIFDVEVGQQSAFHQGLLRLAALAKEEWRKEEVIQLFEAPAFYSKLGWDLAQVEQYSGWIREIFKQSDWKQGLRQFLLHSVTLSPQPVSQGVSIGSLDALEEVLSLMNELAKDLRPEVPLSLADWATRWEKVAEKYLRADEEGGAAEAFHRLMNEWRQADSRLEGAIFPFEVIESFLTKPCSGVIHANQLQAVRMASLELGAIQPARAVFLIGMDEDSFPRKSIQTSLNLLKVGAPDRAEIDRYLLLQVLFAAGDFLTISYGHLSADEGKPVNPALPIQELASLYPVPREEISYSVNNQYVAQKCFSLLSPPAAFSLEPAAVSLADLASFARNPWKYHLQKRMEIYFEDRTERSFALERAPILRASLQWPVDQAISSSRSAPSDGLIGEAFRIDVTERAADLQSTLKEWGATPFSLSFLKTVRAPEGRERPPLEVEFDGRKVQIVGEIQFVLKTGALHRGEDTFSGFLKNWPEILAALIATGSQSVYSIKTGRVRKVADPEGALRLFLSYFLRCQNSLTPLLPDWGDALLRKTPAEFSTDVEYPDPYVEWIMPRIDIPSPEALYAEWDWLRQSFAPLIEVFA